MPKIEYVGVWGQSGERFRLITDGGTHPAMEILVDVDDSIYVAPIVHDNLIPGDCVLQTLGKVHRHESNGIGVSDEDFIAGMIAAVALSPSGVCLAALYSYVLPRAATLMARCYVPKIDSDVDVNTD